jgi:hypothetical protein
VDIETWLTLIASAWGSFATVVGPWFRKMFRSELELALDPIVTRLEVLERKHGVELDDATNIREVDFGDTSPLEVEG